MFTCSGVMLLVWKPVVAGARGRARCRNDGGATAMIAVSCLEIRMARGVKKRVRWEVKGALSRCLNRCNFATFFCGDVVIFTFCSGVQTQVVGKAEGNISGIGEKRDGSRGGGTLFSWAYYGGLWRCTWGPVASVQKFCKAEHLILYHVQFLGRSLL